MLGRVLLDGQDISELPLNVLRGKALQLDADWPWDLTH